MQSKRKKITQKISALIVTIWDLFITLILFMICSLVILMPFLIFLHYIGFFHNLEFTLGFFFNKFILIYKNLDSYIEYWIFIITLQWYISSFFYPGWEDIFNIVYFSILNQGLYLAQKIESLGLHLIYPVEYRLLIIKFKIFNYYVYNLLAYSLIGNLTNISYILLILPLVLCLVLWVIYYYFF